MRDKHPVDSPFSTMPPIINDVIDNAKREPLIVMLQGISHQ
jgi:hypothetical protein